MPPTLALHVQRETTGKNEAMSWWVGVLLRVPSELEEPVLVLLADPPDGMVHDPNRSTPPPPPDEDEVEVLVSDDVPPSPPSALSRVITSRKEGRMVGSWCQQLPMRSTNSAGTVACSSSGIGGLALSLSTATATAAGLTHGHRTTTTTRQARY
jgi:hypothetical protein